MADNITLKRIVDLVTQNDINDSVYTIIDSVSGAVKKYPVGSLICSIAPIFDSSESYIAGAYCNYNGQLYAFTEDHAAGAWTGSDASAVTLSDILESQDGDITELKEASNSIKTAVTESLGTAESGIVSYQDLSVYNSNKHIECDVTAGMTVHVKGYQHNYIYPAAFVVGDGVKKDLFPNATSSTAQEGTFVIESGYAKLYVNGATGVVTPIAEKITDVLTVNKSRLFCKINDSVLETISKYGNDKDIKVNFGKRGPNNLPDFKTLYLSDNNQVLPLKENTFTQLMSPATDFFSPFVVQAVSNDDGDKPTGYASHFTGGNHSYTNEATGVATARCDHLTYKINGQPVTNFEGYCDIVEIAWDSYIQGNNTKKADGTGREILKTHHIVRFDGYNWNVFVYLLPLENIVIKTWYGLQICGLANARYNKVRYQNANNRIEYAYNVSSTSGNKTANGIIAYGNGNKESVFIDNTIDIGDRSLYTAAGSQGAFTMPYGKSYFTIISGTDEMTQGNYYYLKGMYRFESDEVTD